MNKRKAILTPSCRKVLKALGENLRLARLRRRLSTSQVSERANIGRKTLYNIENGSPGVAIGLYCQALFVLGLEKDLIKVAADDILGRKLQDAELAVKERAPKKNVNER